MSAQPAVGVYVDCDDERERERFDALLAELSSPALRVDEVARPQHADVILLRCADMPAALAARERAGSEAARVWVDGGAGGDVQAAWASGCDERLGLGDDALRWVRVLRLLGAARRAHRRAAQLRASYREAVHGGGRGGWVWDLNTGNIRFDPGWKATLGYTDEECGDDAEGWLMRVHAHDRDVVRAGLESLIGGRSRDLELEHRIQCRDRSYRWVRLHGELRSDAHGLRIEGTQVDITAEKLTALRLADADRADPLTGALKRQAFLAALDARVADPARPFALAVCDIDELKHINRRWGRSAGDDVLLWLAGLFEDRFGVDGCWGRTSSDKFAFVIEGDGLVAFAATAAAVREELVAEVFVGVGGAEFRASATVAVAECHDGVRDGSELLYLADRALDHARAAREGVWLLTTDAAELASAPTLRTTSPVAAADAERGD